MPSPLQRAETAATVVGVVTLGIGVALTAAPSAAGRAVGVPDGADTGLRAIGIVDLVIALGLLAARPRWPWLVARAAANPPTAVYLASLARRHRSRALYPVAAFIAGATLADLHASRALRDEGR